MRNLKFFLLLTAVTLLIVSCGGKEYYNNTLVINKDLSIDAVFVSDFPTEKYNIDEMKKEIRESVELYNEDHAGAVKFKSCALRDEKAFVEMKFASGNDYAAFNDVDFYLGPLTEALSGGNITADTEVAQFDDGTITTVAEIPEDDRLILLKTEETADIVFKGSISYENKYVKTDEETGTISVDFEEDDDKTAVLIYMK